MNIALIGCGYVADFYMATLPSHEKLHACGAYDIDAARLRAFCDHHAIEPYESLEDLLQDPDVEMVLNLTNPRSHYEVTRACIEAGKHVYSEKPLSMDYESAKDLVGLANKAGVQLASAPCNVLSVTARTMREALRENVVGRVSLVYASFDAGMTAQLSPWLWRSASGAPWPARDEFEVGCTYQHAGYLLTWLAAFFGPARKVTAFAACQMPDKGVPVSVKTPDLTVGCIEYDGGVVARVTNSILAPSNRSLEIIGDRGVIYTKDVRDDASPVYVSETPPGRIAAALEYRINHWSNQLERALNWIPWGWGGHWRFRRRYPFVDKPAIRSSARYKPVDFCLGPADMVAAIEERRPCLLSAKLALHVTELIEVLQYPQRFGGSKDIESSFVPPAGEARLPREEQ